MHLRDCDDPNFRERLSGVGILLGCAAMEIIRTMRLPGAITTGALVALWSAVQVANARNWPDQSWWSSGNAGDTAYIVLAILTPVATLLVVYGYVRLLKRQSRRNRFAAAARELVNYIEKETSLGRHEIGVNIWLVKGLPGFRRLVRSVIEVAQPRKETHITWTKGKGIIGQSWAQKRSRFADLETVRGTFTTARLWCELERDDRFRLSWAEFQRTKAYRSVLAVPLQANRLGRHPVRGVLAIDVLTPSKRMEIDGIQETDEVSSVIRFCEAALVGDD